MDEGRPRTRRVILTLCLLLGGCAGVELPPASLPPALPFEELKQSVSRVRGLKFHHDVTLASKTTEEIRELLERDLLEESDKDNLARLARVYARLGLLPEETDLSKALLELHLLREPAHYEPYSRSVVAPQRPLKPGPTFLKSPWPLEEDKARQLLIVHSLAHALQEQNFYRREKIKDRNTEDARLALRALRSGDAALVGLAHLTGGSKEKILESVKALQRQAAQADRDIAHLPQLLRQQMIFEYVHGIQFVMWAYSLKDWEGVNRVFARPPLSTTQILHPERYYGKREDPLWLTSWHLIRQFPRHKRLENSLGEYLIRCLLARDLSKDQAERAAAGWSGDTVMAFEQGEELVLAWVSAWENKEEAREFYHSYRGALESRHGISLESAGAETLKSAGGRPLLLQMKDNLVFFLDGVGGPRATAIAEAVWSDLEAGTEPPSLELGRGHSPFAVK